MANDLVIMSVMNEASIKTLKDVVWRASGLVNMVTFEVSESLLSVFSCVMTFCNKLVM